MDQLIHNFSIKSLADFFKKTISAFKIETEDINNYIDDKDFSQFSELTRIGNVSFKDSDELIVFACKYKGILSERSSKKKQFEIAKLVLNNDRKDASIFVFYDESRKFRFSYIRRNWDGKADKKYSPWKRFTYFITPEEHNKTFRQRIGNCTFKDLDSIHEAFSVEKLTKEFYNDLFKWYQWTLTAEVGITFPNDTATSDDDRVKLEEQMIRLITRLLFVWFIKQKHLVPDGLFKTGKLSEILKDFEPHSTSDGSYYNAILQNLFFATLNNEIENRKFATDNSYQGKSIDYGIKTLFRNPKGGSWFTISNEEVLEIFNEIPFLNGGLFECLDKDNPDSKNKIIYTDGFSRETGRQKRAFIPNCVFFGDGKNEGLIHLLERYNFTVEENVPNEVQVALDPELLGNVFENLLGAFNPETQESARKQSGSFYTPKEIVSYMVDESLIAYLNNALPDLEEELIRQLLEQESLPEFLAEDNALCEKIAVRLRSVKILDPACGSGAFPMGILNRMVEILEKLDIKNKENHYNLKLHLIEECIYGVDIQTIAAQISKLRFFISLIVEQEKDITKPNFGIVPLPNLETKFVAANTLIGLETESKDRLDLNDSTLKVLKKDLWDVRQRHFAPKSVYEKKKLRQKDAELRDQIKSYLSGNTSMPDLEKIKANQDRIEKLLIQRKSYETENWVEDFQKEVQTSIFDDQPKQVSMFRIDLNEKPRTEIDRVIKALQVEVNKEKSKTQKEGFEKTVDAIASWNPYDQNASSPFFDPEWMFGLSKENGGFDITIGNPPYGAKLSKSEIDSYKKSYNNKTSETAILFIEKGLNLTSTKGCLFYIIPKSFTYASNYSSIRNYVKEKLNILVDCGKAFEKVKLEACIVGIKQNNQSQTYSSMLFNPNKGFVQIGNIEKRLKEIFGFFPNGITQAEIAIGLKIMQNSFFLNDIAINSRGEMLQKHLQPNGKYSVIGGKEIDRFGMKSSKGYINEKGIITEKAKISTNSVLVQNIVAHITKPFDQIKIIATIPQKKDVLILDTINQITIKNETYSNKIIWVLLNSKLINWYAYLFVFAKAIRTMHFDNSVTERIPIANNILSVKETLFEIYTQIADLKKNNKNADVSELEYLIDKTLYGLYELSDEEIAIIENT